MTVTFPTKSSLPLHTMESRITTWVQLCMEQILCDLKTV